MLIRDDKVIELCEHKFGILENDQKKIENKKCHQKKFEKN